MFSSQYKSLVHKFGLSSRNHCNLLNLRKNQYNSNAFGSLVGSFLNKYQFSSKKPSILTQKQQKQVKKQKKDAQQSEYLWKVNLALNMIGIGAGFYFPKEATMFVLTSSSLFQISESSKSISQIKELVQKGLKMTPTDSENVLPEMKQQLKKIVISMGFLLVASIAIGLGLTYSSFRDYSLLGLNFWILFNIKFTGFSHGYYFVLLALAAFQYLYFQRVFDQNKQTLPVKR